MEPAISIKDLLVNQGGNFSLSIDRLDLLPHHIYALTGPNGAGKTTLLRTMALLITPQRGSIRIAGADGTSLTRQRRKVTLVEQSPYLLAGNVSDNLSYGLRLRGIRGKEQVERIDATLELVGLAGFAERKADKLSAGEVQRVALARGLVLQPEVLLLDEPTSNIDSKSLQSFETLLKSLPGYGVTVVFSTHDLAQPGRLDSEMLRIEHGCLLD